MPSEETIHYLEMTDPGALRPARPPAIPYKLVQAELPCPEFSRFLYTAAGGDWFWIDRLEWTYQQWYDYVTHPGHETWVAYVNGTPAGYFELENNGRDEVELVFLGLLPQFSGLGLGGALLTDAVYRAWTLKPRRLWLHTCSFDHPAALQNYMSRGFQLVRTEMHQKCMPSEPSGPWPRAMKTPEMTQQLVDLLKRTKT